MTRAEREEQKAVLERLRRDARLLAERFRLPLRGLDAESPRVKRRYGICYDDGTIKIRMRHVRSGELLKYSGLIDTLCHELAHLRHFDHGQRFQALHRQILEYARRNGIYRPSARGATAAQRPLAQRPLPALAEPPVPPAAPRPVPPAPPRPVAAAAPPPVAAATPRGGPIQLELFPAAGRGRIRDP